MDNQKGSVISAMFLVGGTCIGGGMLALPVATSIMGFLPAFVVMFVCWVAMTCTGLLLLEASLWMHEGEHIISMSKRFLGRMGEIVAGGLYLFMCYASLIAYTAGSGSQIAAAMSHVTGWVIDKPLGCTIFVVVFGLVIYLGRITVGRINTILFLAMIGAYLALVGFGIPEIHFDLLGKHSWKHACFAIPLLLTSFSFQTLVPSMPMYLKNNVKQLRMAIVGGTTIAFLIYFVWQALILGIVPVDGPNGLIAALDKGEPATRFLHSVVKNPWVPYIAEYFAFFALVTSFLGIAMGLFDFLSDGLSVKEEGWGKVFLGLVMALPTLFFAIQFERAFLVALDTSGGYGDSILNGIIPVLMVWVGRYKLGLPSATRLPGGKVVLASLLVFYLFSVTFETLVHLGVVAQHPPTMAPIMNVGVPP